MKEIKLTGRELSLLRFLDFSTGTPAGELMASVRLEQDDFLDVVNGLLEVGYLEMDTNADRLLPEAISATVVEVNPSYASELREAMYRR